jgi:hypothetical protein
MVPMAELHSPKKGGKGQEKSVLARPSTKKTFPYVTSKISTGVKKIKTQAAAPSQSDGLTAKRRDEPFGRVSTHLLAKFLQRKYTQSQFVYKIKKENNAKTLEIGSDFNFLDKGFETYIPHEARLNKRPYTGQPA